MYRIGIDLGGTNIKVGIVNEQHKLLYQCGEPTNVERPAEYTADRIACLVRKLMEDSKMTRDEISFLGIGSPGAIDIKRGIVLFSNNFMWENVPLAEMLHIRLSIPVIMANDAQCALIGELEAGAAAGCGNVVLITLGTGVGGSILADGKLLNYKKGGGIIGHMVIHKNGRRCSCGRRGCLEAYASASALIRMAESCIGEYPHSLLAEYAVKHGGITGKTVFDAAKEQDSLAQKIIKEYIEDLGEGIANIINIFRPDKILIGGGISNQKEELINPLTDYVYEQCFAKEKLFLPEIECAALGNTAGIVGAAALERYIT